MPASPSPRPDPAPPEAPRGIIYLKLLLVAFFWGGTFIAGRLAAQHVAPFSAAFLRFLIASAALLAVVWQRGGRLPVPTRGLLLPVALLGLSGVFAYNVCFFEGLRRIEAGRAALIIANGATLTDDQDTARSRRDLRSGGTAAAVAEARAARGGGGVGNRADG